MQILPNIPQGVECLKSFKLYGYGEYENIRTTLNEAVEVSCSELRLSQAWCHFEVDAATAINRRVIGMDPNQPHVEVENIPTLEEQVCGGTLGTDFGLALNGGGFSLKARHRTASYMDSPNSDGPCLRKQVNDFKVKDFIKSAELKPGEDFITDTKLVIGFLTPRNIPGSVAVNFKGKAKWLIPIELPVCFMPGVLMRCVGDSGSTPGKIADSVISNWVFKQWNRLGLAPKPRFHAYGYGPFDWFLGPPPVATLVVAIVGPVGEPAMVRETKVFTTEYFDFLTNLDNRRELWRATEPDLDAVEDLHHGEVPVPAVNF
jgi:hypothetical protein